MIVGTAVALAVGGVFYADRRRKQYGLYFGTVARAVATIYALVILVMSLTVQPWLMYNEASLLRQDKLVAGYMADTRHIAGLSLVEARAVEAYNADLRKALEGNGK